MPASSRWFRFVALAAVAVISGTVNCIAQNDQKPQPGGTAITISAGEPTGLNPTITSNTPEQFAGCIVYEGLVLINQETGKAEPALAKSWEISSDEKTYTFHLRDANFHDGTPLTSEDVRYTLMEVSSKFHPTFSAQTARKIQSVTTPDPKTVKITLTQPFGPFLLNLTCTNGAGILPAHLFTGTDPLKNLTTLDAPVGTGPFKFAEWVRGSHIRMVRNEEYWDKGKPYLDSIVMQFVPNSASRTQSMLAGQADFVSGYEFSSSDVKTARATPSLKLEKSGFAASQVLAFFNLTRKPISDVEVRRALLTATDTAYIAATAFPGTGEGGTKPWNSIPWSANENVDYRRDNAFDAKRAGQLLDEAGYKPDANGVRFKLGVIYDAQAPELDQIAQTLKAWWKAVGVEVELQPVEEAVFVPRVFTNADFDVMLTGYSTYNDPAIGIARIYISSTIGKLYGNASHYSNPQVDALFEKGAASTNLQERGAEYKKAQEIIVRDLPTITLAERYFNDVMSTKLHGVHGYLGTGQWANAWLEQ